MPAISGDSKESAMSPSLRPTHTPTPLPKNYCEENIASLSLVVFGRPSTSVNAATNRA